MTSFRSEISLSRPSEVCSVVFMGILSKLLICTSLSVSNRDTFILRALKFSPEKRAAFSPQQVIQCDAGKYGGAQPVVVAECREAAHALASADQQVVIE